MILETVFGLATAKAWVRVLKQSAVSKLNRYVSQNIVTSLAE